MLEIQIYPICALQSKSSTLKYVGQIQCKVDEDLSYFGNNMDKCEKKFISKSYMINAFKP